MASEYEAEDVRSTRVCARGEASGVELPALFSSFGGDQECLQQDDPAHVFECRYGWLGMPMESKLNIHLTNLT